MISGVIPVAPTTFHDDESLDLASQTRVIDFLENRQCGLRAAKVLLREGGIIGSEATRRPIGPLPAWARDGLLELARRRDPLVLRWRRDHFAASARGR